jgi:hypothetical protein
VAVQLLSAVAELSLEAVASLPKLAAATLFFLCHRWLDLDSIAGLRPV